MTIDILERLTLNWWNEMLTPTTADNSMFAVRFAHLNAFGTSQTRKSLGEIATRIDGLKFK